MRFRGGGVGHLYMRHVEPWLDATGWGMTWPLLQDREPDVAQDTPAQSHGGTGSAISTGGQQRREGDGDGEDDDSEEDTDPGEQDDNDGEDLEQPEEDEDYDSEEDKDPSSRNKCTYSGDGTDEEDEEEVGHNL